MRRQLVVILALAAAMALGTWWLGWWVVPVLGAAWGVARYGAYPSTTAGVAAALGWTALLGIAALQGPMGEVSRTVGGVLSAPGWVPLALTALFPAGLAAASARVSGALMPLLEGASARHDEPVEPGAAGHGGSGPED
jgi:hypothetical protein